MLSSSSSEDNLLSSTGDDGVIRCICGTSEDDGYTIQCEGCWVWQHIACVGLNANTIPLQYFCEECLPRTLDAERARQFQLRRMAAKRSGTPTVPSNRISSSRIGLMNEGEGNLSLLSLPPTNMDTTNPHTTYNPNINSSILSSSSPSSPSGIDILPTTFDLNGTLPNPLSPLPPVSNQDNSSLLLLTSPTFNSHGVTPTPSHDSSSTRHYAKRSSQTKSVGLPRPKTTSLVSSGGSFSSSSSRILTRKSSVSQSHSNLEDPSKRDRETTSWNSSSRHTAHTHSLHHQNHQHQQHHQHHVSYLPIPYPPPNSNIYNQDEGSPMLISDVFDELYERHRDSFLTLDEPLFPSPCSSPHLPSSESSYSNMGKLISFGLAHSPPILSYPLSDADLESPLSLLSLPPEALLPWSLPSPTRIDPVESDMPFDEFGVFAERLLAKGSLVATILGELRWWEDMVTSPLDMGWESLPMEESFLSSKSKNPVLTLPPFLFPHPALSPQDSGSKRKRSTSSISSSSSTSSNSSLQPSSTAHLGHVVCDTRFTGKFDGRFLRFSCGHEAIPNAVLRSFYINSEESHGNGSRIGFESLGSKEQSTGLTPERLGLGVFALEDIHEDEEILLMTSELSLPDWSPFESEDGNGGRRIDLSPSSFQNASILLTPCICLHRDDCRVFQVNGHRHGSLLEEEKTGLDWVETVWKRKRESQQSPLGMKTKSSSRSGSSKARLVKPQLGTGSLSRSRSRSQIQEEPSFEEIPVGGPWSTGTFLFPKRSKSTSKKGRLSTPDEEEQQSLYSGPNNNNTSNRRKNNPRIDLEDSTCPPFSSSQTSNQGQSRVQQNEFSSLSNQRSTSNPSIQRPSSSNQRRKPPPSIDTSTLEDLELSRSRIKTTGSGKQDGRQTPLSFTPDGSPYSSATSSPIGFQEKPVKTRKRRGHDSEILGPSPSPNQQDSPSLLPSTSKSKATSSGHAKETYRSPALSTHSAPSTSLVQPTSKMSREERKIFEAIARFEQMERDKSFETVPLSNGSNLSSTGTTSKSRRKSKNEDGLVVSGGGGGGGGGIGTEVNSPTVSQPSSPRREILGVKKKSVSYQHSHEVDETGIISDSQKKRKATKSPSSDSPPPNGKETVKSESPEFISKVEDSSDMEEGSQSEVLTHQRKEPLLKESNSNLSLNDREIGSPPHKEEKIKVRSRQLSYSGDEVDQNFPTSIIKSDSMDGPGKSLSSSETELPTSQGHEIDRIDSLSDEEVTAIGSHKRKRSLSSQQLDLESSLTSESDTLSSPISDKKRKVFEELEDFKDSFQLEIRQSEERTSKLSFDPKSHSATHKHMELNSTLSPHIMLPNRSSTSGHSKLDSSIESLTTTITPALTTTTTTPFISTSTIATAATASTTIHSSSAIPVNATAIATSSSMDSDPITPVTSVSQSTETGPVLNPCPSPPSLPHPISSPTKSAVRKVSLQEYKLKRKAISASPLSAAALPSSSLVKTEISTIIPAMLSSTITSTSITTDLNSGLVPYTVDLQNTKNIQSAILSSSPHPPPSSSPPPPLISSPASPPSNPTPS